MCDAVHTAVAKLRLAVRRRRIAAGSRGPSRTDRDEQAGAHRVQRSHFGNPGSRQTSSLVHSKNLFTDFSRDFRQPRPPMYPPQAVCRFEPNPAVASAAEIIGQRDVYVMKSILHPVLVLGTTVLALSILFFGGSVINFLSRKPDAIKNEKGSNSRISASSLFERAAIAGTITALYMVLMVSFFVLISWGSLR